MDLIRWLRPGAEIVALVTALSVVTVAGMVALFNLLDAALR